MYRCIYNNTVCYLLIYIHMNVCAYVHAMYYTCMYVFMHICLPFAQPYIKVYTYLHTNEVNDINAYLQFYIVFPFTYIHMYNKSIHTYVSICKYKYVCTFIRINIHRKYTYIHMHMYVCIIFGEIQFLGGCVPR